MNIDVTIERIANGFIITGNDSTREPTYYPTLEKFVIGHIVEQMQEEDKMHRECETLGLKYTLKAELTSKP